MSKTTITKATILVIAGIFAFSAPGANLLQVRQGEPRKQVIGGAPSDAQNAIKVTMATGGGLFGPVPYLSWQIVLTG